MDNAPVTLQYHYTKRTGRPTKYLKSVINPKIEEYLALCGRDQTRLPSIEGLADHLGVISETIRDWVVLYPDFSANIKRIAGKQKEQLMNDGMYGGREVNASMAIFLLKAIHGLKENDPNTLVQVNVRPILGNLDPQ